MKLAFSTGICPGWDLKAICQRASKYGFDAIELDGLEEEADAMKHRAFVRELGASKRMIADAGVEVGVIGTGIRICDEATRKVNLEQAKRAAALALELSCPNIMVLGGDETNTTDPQRAAAVGQQCLREILSIDGAQWLNWLVKTQGVWSRLERCKPFIDGLDHPCVGVAWDVASMVMNAQSPRDVYEQIGARVKSVRIVDAVRDPGHPQAGESGWRLTSLGEGELPLVEVVQLLRANVFGGCLTVGYDKRRSPGLPEPDQLLPASISWIRSATKMRA